MSGHEYDAAVAAFIRTRGAVPLHALCLLRPRLPPGIAPLSKTMRENAKHCANKDWLPRRVLAHYRIPASVDE
jgi:hypothetical protein